MDQICDSILRILSGSSVYLTASDIRKTISKEFITGDDEDFIALAEVAPALAILMDAGYVESYQNTEGHQYKITSRGKAFIHTSSYEQQKREKKEQELAESILRQSVLDTNSATVSNTRQQTNILRRQTLIFWATLIITLGSVIISLFGYLRDDSKRQLERKLDTSEKYIQRLQKQLFSKETPSSTANGRSDSALTNASSTSHKAEY